MIMVYELNTKKLEKLPPIEDRGQTDHVTALSRPLAVTGFGCATLHASPR